MGKAKKVARPAQHEVVTPERRQHGVVMRDADWQRELGRIDGDGASKFSASVQDADGGIGDPFRVLSTLDRMRRAGTISPTMRQAGELFHQNFAIAGFEALRAADMGRVGGGSSGSGMPFRLVNAREEVARAMKALGGIGSPGGSCVWAVLGLGETVQGWATAQGWGGRPIKREVASGVLIGALGVLEVVFGLVKVGRSRTDAPAA